MKLISVKTILGLSGLLLFACNNEDFNERGEVGNPSDYISFGVTPADGVQTKGAARVDAKEYVAGSFVLRSADSADTLCVRTVISDGIQGAAIGEKPVTRGTPLNPDDEFYEAFHVLTIQDGSQTEFFMNDAVKKGTYTDGVWETDETYYWPGAEHTLQFYAWAPIEGSFSSAPTTPAELKFGYTVPADVTAQKDIVVAQKLRAGDYKQAVPLSFKHICTAVRFVVGAQMQPGTIQSISLNGVYNAGTYDMSGLSETSPGSWELIGTGNFKQSLNKAMTGTVGQGEEITLVDGTFMMLPQTLPSGAEVVVEFQDDATGKLRTLKASIAGSEWPIGKTVTYQLAITPEYEFKLEDNPQLDAHYEILLTNLKVTGVPDDKSWSITAREGTTIMLQSQMNNYAKQGYWTDRNMDQSNNDKGSARGESVYNGRGSGTFPIAIFVPENIGDVDRTINLEVRFTDSNDVIETLKLEQFAPSWYGQGVGCERIEGADCPWGFYWTKDFKLIYDLTGCDNASRESIRQYVEWTQRLHDWANNIFIGWLIRWIFGNDIPDLSFVEMETSQVGGGWFPTTIADKITLNLGALETSGIALSTTDGQANTKEIYNFEGLQLVNEIISRIESIPGYKVSTEGEGVNPTNNASIACMKLNSWHIVDAMGTPMLKLASDDGNPMWYLPASGEVSGIVDTENSLSGNYWTSTAIDDNENAYKYSANGSTSSESRKSELHVRAVRRR